MPKQNTLQKGMAMWLSKATLAFFVLVVGWQVADAFVEPSATPPSGNVTAPITAGSPAQTKEGALTVNTDGTSAEGLIVDKGELEVRDGESSFSTGTYSDPDSSETYDARFGGSNNGIAVRGESVFLGPVGIVDITPDSGTGGQLELDIDGQIGATEYCDENGDNCAAITALGGAGFTGTTGSVPFVDGSGSLTEDNANFFWDDTNDYLGIGTVAPTKPIYVSQDENVGTGVLVENLNTGSGASGGFGFIADRVGGYVVARSSSFAGTSASYTHLSDRVTLGTLTTDDGVTANADGIDIAADSVVGDIRLFTGGMLANDERMRIEADGDVGIGTKTVGARLHVLDNANSVTGGAFENDDTGTSAVAGTLVLADRVAGFLGAYSSNFSGSGSSYGHFADRVAVSAVGTAGNPFGIAADGLDLVTDNASGDIRFYTGGALTSNERIRIESDGDVGIGDTTPDTGTGGALKLDVEGNIGAVEYCDENGDNCSAITALGGGGGGSTTFLGLTDTPGTATAGSLYFSDGTDVTEDNANLFWDDTNDALLVATNTRSASLSLDVEGQIGATEYCDEDGLNCSTVTALAGSGADSIDDLTDGINDSSSVFLGSGSGVNDDATANSNTALGTSALGSNTSGSSNTAVGSNALFGTTIGTNNAAVGRNALFSNVGGTQNSAFGSYALTFNIGGSYNTALGYSSLESNTDGEENVGVGRSALISNTSGDYNTAVGYSALGSNVIGLENTVYGHRAGDLVTGSTNTLVGAQAGDLITSGSRNIVLGYNAQVATATADEQLSIGNLIYGTDLDGTGTTISTGSIGIGDSSPDSGTGGQLILDVEGNIGAAEYCDENGDNCSAITSLGGGSESTTISDTTSIDLTETGDDISGVVLPGGVDHDSLLNFDANEHFDHTGISVIAGGGLSGGGTIDADRTIDIDIPGTTAEATTDAADSILVYDASATALRSMTRTNFLAGLGGASALIDLTDVNTSTPTAGNMLLADGTDFESVGLTGDISLDGAGLTTILDNAVDGTDIAIGSDTAGDILYYDGTDYTRLGIGTAGQVLATNAGTTAPEWIAPASGGSESTTISDTTSIDLTETGDDISGVVLPGGVDHDSLLNFDANEHFDHTGISVIAGGGLSGGGTIDADRTIDIDIPGTTAEATTDAADSILVYDASATALRSMTRTNFLAGLGGASALIDLTDVNTSTPTAGNMLLADGTDFESVGLTGDISLDGAGLTTILDNAVDGTDIAIGSDTAGDILYYDGTDYTRLGIGTAGQVLATNAGTTAPEWIAPASGGGSTTFLGLTDTPGSATAGSIYFSDGTDVTEDNANFFWDDTNDYLGIGTASPIARLQVQHDANVITGGLFVNDTTGTDAVSTTMVLADRVSGFFGAFSSSYVGDGSNFGHFSDRVGLSANGAATNPYGIAADGLDLVAADSAADMRFYTGGALTTNERVRIEADGDVGIGTTTPSTRLHVLKDENSRGSGILASNPSAGTDASGGLGFQSDRVGGYVTARSSTFTGLSADYGHLSDRVTFATMTTIDGVTADAEGIDIAADSVIGDIRIFTGGMLANDERMRIEADGDIGIGDTTPDSGTGGQLLLDVEGNVGATGYCDENGDNCVDITTLSGGVATDVDGLSDGNSDTTDDLFLGTGAGASSTGADNTGVGINALALNVGGASNTAFGQDALSANVSGIGNTAVGHESLDANTGDGNTATGGYSLRFNSSGANNTAVGTLASEDNTLGDNNTAVGAAALHDNTGGDSNTAIGRNAITITSGDENIALGAYAGDTITTGSHNIVIGYAAEVPTVTADNQLSIGNLIYGTGLSGENTTISGGDIGIGIKAPQRRLHVEDTGDAPVLRLGDSDGTCDIEPEASTLLVTCASDVRLKEDIVDAEGMLAYMDAFRIRDYTIRASGDAATGVIAQEVLETHPELVKTNPQNDMLMVEAPNTWKIVGALQELLKKVEALFDRTDEQESEIKKLQSEMDALRVELETVKKSSSVKIETTQ